MIYEKIVQRRTIRKFEPKKIPENVLRKCVDAARLSPSSKNLQPIKYIIVNDDAMREQVFPALKWASYIPSYPIAKGERPQAYIVMLLDTSINKDALYDPGIAAMTICMVAFDEGLGSCMMAGIDRDKLRSILKIPENLEIKLVISLGYPSIKAYEEKMKNDNDFKYWLDKEGNFHVPKRDLKTIVKWNTY